VINVPFNAGNKVNIQTDLEYVQENFEPEDYTLRLDTVSFTAEITIDTTGFGAMRSTGWLSMNVNTDSRVEVEEQDQFVATEVSIIPGNEYILTVSKIDAETGKKEEVFIPLLRDVKYDFTSKPQSPEHYEESLQDFLAGREKLETMEGTLIDITILSKELQIAEDDEVSFSLLPVRKLKKDAPQGEIRTSSLLLDNKVVEFTYIHKYTINIPLSEEGKVNMQTNLQHLEENFNPAYFTVNVDTLSFFTEIQIDTIGLGERVIPEVDEIKDPVFDKVVIYFDVNEHELKPDARKNIQENVIIELKKDSRLYVTIEGYTDALGDADYNLELSRKRARSVQYYLMKNGIGQKRIRTFSFGETQALQEGLNWEDLSEEELRKHRKVEIVIYLPK
jgi:outer membrane protein OmpA-like peptidoglycan-associated protein